jgi:L-lactate dehydrogenase
MHKSTVAIIGVGAVGATAAYTLLLRGLAARIILVDINQERCRGEIEDLRDARPFGSGAIDIVQGTLEDAARADIIVITAGIAQKPGQPRIDLLETNKKVILSLLQGLQPINPNAIIIMVTNPVDVLTLLAQNTGILPRNQIFGSGTLLDSQRLRGAIGEKLNIAQQSIHIYSLGEHGDSQFVAWSWATVGGVPLSNFKAISVTELDTIALNARKKVYDIIACKGSTSFGIAACVSAYCQNILYDQKRVAPVSCYLPEYGVCMSMPAVIGARGVESILPLTFTDTEKKQLETSAATLKKLVA